MVDPKHAPTDFAVQSTYKGLDESPAAASAGDAAWRLWACSIVLGALATLTLYGAAGGLNWPLFVAGTALALFCLERPRLASAWRRYVLVGCAVVLAGALAVTAEPFTRGLIVAVLCWLAAVVVQLDTALAPACGALRIVFAPVFGALATAARAATVTGLGVRAIVSERWYPLLRGGALSMPVVACFFLLLSQADPTFALWRAAVGSVISSLAGWMRLAYFVLITGALAGFLSTRCVTPVTRSGTVARAARLTAIERQIVIGAVAMVFSAFIVLQVSYLFGDPGAVRGSGVTYAEAVHRGFGEITLVVSLCGLLLVTLDQQALRQSDERPVTGLSLLVLAQCVLLLWSAYGRLTSYEDAYGYTLARLYVRLWIGYLAIAIVCVAIELRHGARPRRLAWRLAVSALAALCVLGLWNWTAWVIEGNVRRFHAVSILDADYVSADATDGIPALIGALPRLPAAEQVRARQLLESLSEDGAPLMAEVPWYEWNLSRARAREALLEWRHASP